MRERILNAVPMWFRTRWPLKRFYWQEEDVAAYKEEAERLIQSWSGAEGRGDG